MIKVRMTKTVKGSNDGILVKTYNEGEEYEVSQSLGRAFIAGKLAELVPSSVVRPQKKEKEISDEGKQQKIKYVEKRVKKGE